MKRLFFVAALAVFVSVLPASAAGLTGKYIEARTCDVWTGPCFANAEMNLTGKHAVLGWKVEKGEFQGVSLDGLGRRRRRRGQRYAGAAADRQGPCGADPR